MNQLEALTTLVDAARQMPENKHLIRAIKVAEKLIERRREKKERAALKVTELAEAEKVFRVGSPVTVYGELGMVILANHHMDAYLVRVTKTGKEVTVERKNLRPAVLGYWEESNGR